MVWCSQCQAEVEIEADEANGFSCCVQCGRVVEDTAFSSDVMFSKGADGGGELVGQMVGANGDAHGMARYAGGRMWASGGGHEASVSRGRHEIVALVEALRISPSSEAIEAAHRLYRLALQRGFTKGRRVNQVAAVCLYIFCRLERRPYMLIDFSDQLSVNVYALGAVFLNMLRLLRLDEHATFTKPIDPSLFMNRFVDRLRLPTQELKTKIGNTATRLVQSMKRDWMLTGRRPNGICGAALFLAAHIHGVEKTKMDIISVVHVGWSTVERRVLELAETGGAELTLKEIEDRDKASELEREQMLLDYERAAAENAANAHPQLAWPEEGPAEGDTSMAVVPSDPNAAGKYCEHVRAGAPLLAHGMCRPCLEEYLQVTMSVREGAQNPPAFIRNLRRDVRKRVRAQLEGERPMLLQQGQGPLALEDDSDIHEQRHLENEAAAEEGGDAGAGGGPAALPSTSQAAEGPSGAGKEGGGRKVSAAEEDEFDEALHSSDLQPLAKALGGAVAAVALAPRQFKRLRRHGGAAADTETAADPSAAAEAALLEETVTADAAKDARTGEPSAPAGTASTEAVGEPAARDDAGLASGSVAATGDGSLALVDPAPQQGQEQAITAVGDNAVTVAGGVVAAGDDEDELSSDHLSDVDEDDIAGYLATREEASVREQLWTEMNKDWIEKQQAKKAAEAAEGAAGGEKPKRKYNRKKAELPAAEDAAGATRNLLAAKKLSNKINYGALADLFGSGGTAGPAKETDSAGPSGSGLQAADAGGSGAYGAYSWQGDAGPSGATSAGEYGEAAAAGPAAGASGRGSGRAGKAAAGESDRYSAALEEEQSRLGGLGGGGFLGSLTFMRGGADAKGGGGARARPQGLSLKPRGR